MPLRRLLCLIVLGCTLLAQAGPSRAQDPEGLAVLRALKDPDRETRRKAAKILADEPRLPKSVVLPLIDALSDKDRVVRASVAEALAHVGPEAVVAVPSLKEALKDKDFGV